MAIRQEIDFGIATLSISQIEPEISKPLNIPMRDENSPDLGYLYRDTIGGALAAAITYRAYGDFPKWLLGR